jgi:hypothetical protein
MTVQAAIHRIEENNNGISISEDKGKNSEKSERISRE